ncbi:MAG TPA: ornithine--oxo-acid transaminase [Candidatus Limnocylindrales bacterium]|nr:ornithine--oxo-acid transaminase [Candidatus Limnocylindrales bacterium]
MLSSKEILDLTDRYSARNYLPLPVVLSWGEGVWVEDPEGNRYMDMLSAYSAMNFGHRHPKIIKALKDQADRITVTSRAFQNDQLGNLCYKLAELTGKEMVLPMNTGAEAVETAIKAARRWAYREKKIPMDKAEIITCGGNFHGRTITIISFSSNETCREEFGPFTPGFKLIAYGSSVALEKAITPNTAAFLVEPVQGEGGIIIPPDGYLKNAFQICKENNVLFLADEIQTGLGRTGKMFACDWEDVKPDVYILGKALGGGILPISAVTANTDILGVFEPGSHGSTFGGNPLACAVAVAALDTLQEEQLVVKSNEVGNYFVKQLRNINSPLIVEVRGRGMMVGVELTVDARPFCEELMRMGILTKETHENVIRFAPPLVITRDELDWALEIIRKVFAA